MIGSAGALAQFAASPILLAQHGRYVHMGRRFRRGAAAPDLSDLFILIGVLVAIAVAVWLLVRFFHAKEQTGSNSPRQLFGELCRAHGLDWKSRRLLLRLARSHQLRQPARIFLEPERFDAARFGKSLQPHREQLLRLRDAIFGQRIERRKATRAARLR